MIRLLSMVVVMLVTMGCETNPHKQTIALLRDVELDVQEVQVDDSLVKALSGYQHFLNETPEHTMAPEAMRRMADLKIEKEYGVIGTESATTPVEMAAPKVQSLEERPVTITVGKKDAIDGAPALAPVESDIEFEQRATALGNISGHPVGDLELPEGSSALEQSGPAQAIATYQKILSEYPWYERNDQVLYQMARAYDELARPDDAMRVAERLIVEHPDSRYVDEVYFRRGEYYFVRRAYLDAEESYRAVVGLGDWSDFYELALYKLGWSLYKQELYEEALNQYIALLDYKLAMGYDFDVSGGEDVQEEERRVADTFRVISLSFSNLGSTEELSDYFSTYGNRSFEDRIYRNLAEFHLDKRRFNDAASVYKAFVDLNPYHKAAPHFSMRVSEIYGAGNFPLLVVESKRDFANRYGVVSDYWQYFDLQSMPDVLEYLKTNLIDLANHYHALYQQEDLEEEQPDNYGEALHWYHEYLDSFPQDTLSPSINYQLADLLFEHEDYAESAREYERTAYEYPIHDRAAEAGYAAIYAYRKHLGVLPEAESTQARLATVDSSLLFVERFPAHEQAPKVLGSATEDLYAMKDFERAISSGRWLVETYAETDRPLRRAAWMIVAHSSFDTANYPDAEAAYAEVLALTQPEDEDRQLVIDNLAAAIYKQGEQARDAGDYASASEHFLRIKSAAPTSEIRAAAEYDAASALIFLEDWWAAAHVFEDFRASHPEHELNSEATKQLAVVYENAGELSQSATEYERVAAESEDLEVRREALLVAGDLYEQAASGADALRIYGQFIDEFPEPIELALEIRFKVAGMQEKLGNDVAYREQLRAIVAIDAAAGQARTDRTRYLAASSSLVLTRPMFDEFESLSLVQPFEQSLAAKRQLMDQALAGFETLVSYEVAEVTAAATFYIAEIYRHFSSALLDSERPAGLNTSDLAEYELVIEEEAYPFEERAISVHQDNLELMRVGVFNHWIQRSMDELAVLMPGRYAKREISGGFVGNIEVYAYRKPMPPEMPGQTTELAGVDDDAISP